MLSGKSVSILPLLISQYTMMPVSWVVKTLDVLLVKFDGRTLCCQLQ